MTKKISKKKTGETYFVAWYHIPEAYESDWTVFDTKAEAIKKALEGYAEITWDLTHLERYDIPIKPDQYGVTEVLVPAGTFDGEDSSWNYWDEPDDHVRSIPFKKPKVKKSEHGSYVRYRQREEARNGNPSKGKTSKKKPAFAVGDYVAVLGLDHTFGTIVEVEAEWKGDAKEWLYRVDVGGGAPMLVAEDSLERVEKFYIGDVVADQHGEVGTVRDTDYVEGMYRIETESGFPQWNEGKWLKLVRKAGEVISYRECKGPRPKVRGSKPYWVAWYDAQSADSDYVIYDDMELALEAVREYSQIPEILHDEYGLARVFLTDRNLGSDDSLGEWEDGSEWSFWEYGPFDKCKEVPLKKTRKKSNPESDAGTAKRMMNPKNY